MQEMCSFTNGEVCFPKVIGETENEITRDDHKSPVTSDLLAR